MTSMSSHLNKAVREHYMRLPQGDKCQVTYIWIDGNGWGLGNKIRTLDAEPKSIQEVPEWYFSGPNDLSKNSCIDMRLIPACMFKDPFNLDPNKLVLCEVFNYTNLAAEANHRMSCKKVMDQVQKHQLLFSIKQEYTLTTIDGHLCGWPQNGFPASQDPKATGRDIAVCHYKACRYAGINIFRKYEKDRPWQCEFQIGHCEGIEMGDQLWVARFLLHRVCEDFGVVATLNPNPIKGNWNGSGGHTNFSTKQMREEGESCLIVDHLMKNPGERRSRYIEEAMKKLNVEHIKVSNPHSGQDNMSRHETPNMDKFSTEISNRGASIRFPHQVVQDKKGEFAAHCDPYLVTKAIASMCLLDDEEVKGNKYY